MSQNQQIPSGSGECPVCHGTGWEIYREAVEGYKGTFRVYKKMLKVQRKKTDK